jgi:hypothetical protein
MLEEDIRNFTIAVEANDVNNSVYYGAYFLRYFHPFCFHCYYMYVEAVNAVAEYINLDSAFQILSNVIYKTG